jgi:hypothetical protein
MQLFTSIIYEFLYYARVYIHDKLFNSVLKNILANNENL